MGKRGPQGRALLAVKTTLACGPRLGMTLPQIAKATGCARETSKSNVYRALADGLIVRLDRARSLGGGLYFSDQAALEAARPEVHAKAPAAERKVAKTRAMARVAPRVRAEAIVNAMPGKQQVDPARKQKFSATMREAPAAGVQVPNYIAKAPKTVTVVCPPNVKRTVAPTLVDYRYHVSPHFIGEFGREWGRLRGGRV